MTPIEPSPHRLVIDPDVASILAADAERHPRWADVQNRWGLLLLVTGRPEEALAAFERALGVNPFYGWACVNRAQTLALIGRVDRARARLEEGPEPARGVLAYAAAALPLFDATVGPAPSPAIPPDLGSRPDFLRLAAALQARTDPARAREMRDDARRGYAAIGAEALVPVEDDPDPRASLLTFFPGLHQLFLEVSGLEARLGRWDDAEGSVRTAALLWFDLAAALHQQGFLASLRGDDTAAVELWQRAQDAGPDDPKPSVALGYYWSACGDLDRAQVALGEALRRAPGYADLHYQLGLVLRARGTRDESLVSFRRALAINPDYAVARLEEAGALFELERWTEARDAYAAVVDAGFNSSDIQIRLGRIEEVLGNQEGAAQAYRAAGRLNPNDPLPHYHLGCLHRRDGDRASAKKAWGRFLELEGDPVRQAAVRADLEELDA